MRNVIRKTNTKRFNIAIYTPMNYLVPELLEVDETSANFMIPYRKLRDEQSKIHS
jgi:hypothetical protein